MLYYLLYFSGRGGGNGLVPEVHIKTPTYQPTRYRPSPSTCLWAMCRPATILRNSGHSSLCLDVKLAVSEVEGVFAKAFCTMRWEDSVR